MIKPVSPSDTTPPENLMRVATIPQQPQVKHIELPTTVSSATHRGLYARWEVVNGKLSCKWFSNPD